MQTLRNFILESSLNINAFIILKPEFLKYKDEWITMLKNKGWQIVQQKEIQMTKDQAEELYYMHKNKEWYNDLINYMISEKCVIAECHKSCDEPIKDMENIKHKFRDAYGISETKNGMHSSDSLENVERESKIFF